jgi:hypothetical protein
MASTFPLDLIKIFGHWESYIVFFGIGIAFGFVLEMAGFGNSTKLASQFYFKDQTVLKVMFGAIVVAMSLIFLATGIGLLDYEMVWVNPTFLVPGIVGGLIMGVGFIIGGFCPGTSLVATSTFKVDGLFFVLGALVGIFFFGESVGEFEKFWNSTDKGRYTLSDWLGISTGVIVLGIVVMALATFFIAEKLERYFGNQQPTKRPKWHYIAAGSLILIAVAVLIIGQPEPETTVAATDPWDTIAANPDQALVNREVYVEPIELLTVMNNGSVHLVMLDVRSGEDYDSFHLHLAKNTSLKTLADHLPALQSEPTGTVFVVMGNDEIAATNAWKLLVENQFAHVYILSGGLNAWLDTFANEAFKSEYSVEVATEDKLHYEFLWPMGEGDPTSNPDLSTFSIIPFEPKINLPSEAPVSAPSKSGSSSSGGGCG